MNSFDVFLFVIFFLTQTRITLLLLRAARRRFTGAALLAAGGAVGLCGAVVFCGYLLSFSDLAARMGFAGEGAQVWGACALGYLLVSAAAVTLWMVVRAVKRHWGRDLDAGRRRALNTAGAALMAAPLAALGYGFVKRMDFHVREIDVPARDLPRDLEGLRILQISDIHLSPFLSERDLERVIDAAAGIRAHLAVVTGDLISSRGDPLDACIRQLARVKAEAGVFGCMGNHERYARVEDYTERAAARVGIRFLRGQNRQLRFGDAVLNLAGVDHQSLAGKKAYLRGAERMVAPGAFNLLLSHNPDVFPVAARQGYNFMLSGHTHGGQITVEILDESISAARFFTPYVYGLYKMGGSAAYVTRGIGTIGIPARIGAPPEICVLRLIKA